MRPAGDVEGGRHPAAPRVVVVGGGIAGLAAARAVGALCPTAQVLVLEASAHPGGKLRSADVAGTTVDVGAEAALATRAEAVELIRDVGLGEEMITPSTMAASVFAGGRLHPMPAGTLFGIPGDAAAARASGALGEHTLAGVTAEPGLAPLAPVSDDISVGALVRSRLGDEVVDRLVEPLLGGVYAGRVDRMSLRATMPTLAARLAVGGSLVDAVRAVSGTGTRARGAGPAFVSLRGGLAKLAGNLAAGHGIAVRTATTVRTIRRSTAGFELACGPVPQTETIFADAVVIAVPPAKAARLLVSVAPAAATELALIESASVAITTLAYRNVALPPGSGFLVGSREGLVIKAVTFTSQKWPLAADGLVLLRASIGRVGESQVLQRDDDELVALVRHDLGHVCGITAPPVDALVTRWGGGLPQYDVGHVARVARIRASVAEVPGLAVAGAAYDGVGIPACIATGYAAADQVAAALRQRGQWSHGGRQAGS